MNPGTENTIGHPMDVLIVAVPQTAGSSLYGMLEVLAMAGTMWQALTREDPGEPVFRVRIVSTRKRPFDCGNRIPVRPDTTISENPAAPIVILPELWLGPDDSLRGCHPELIEWIRRQYRAGSAIYSACSGAILLAETGLLDGCQATSHWAYAELFEQQYPAVRFRPEPNLLFAEEDGRIVTAGGTTSWHDLALHIIARYGTPGEANRIAQVYLLKWHGEGQLPYTPLLRNRPHGDAIVSACEAHLREHFRESGLLDRVIRESGLAPRTLKRRFKAATGVTLMEYVQNLRMEEAKRLLESQRTPVDEISVQVGYEDASFFRRLFRRRTGLSPRDYRRLFQPIRSMGSAPEGRSAPSRLPRRHAVSGSVARATA